MRTIPAGEFKAQCLALLDEVAQTHEPVLVTKRGKPVACVVPYAPAGRHGRNPLKNSIVFEKDLVDPIDERWEAEHISVA